MTLKSRAIVPLVVATFLAAVPCGHADAIPTNQWLEFAFGNPNSAAFACAGSCVPSSSGNSIEAGNPAWTFTSGDSVDVAITDAFDSGESFRLFDFGNLIGNTPTAVLGFNCGDDPAVCVLDSNFSHGVFLLGAGSHALTIDVLDSPEGGGSAYFRVDATSATPVPEPSSCTLLGVGLVLTMYRRR